MHLTNLKNDKLGTKKLIRFLDIYKMKKGVFNKKKEMHNSVKKHNK